MTRIILPVRSREFGVGKEMVGSIYVHRDYDALLGEQVSIAKRNIPANFAYAVVKLNRCTGAVSFAESPDFNSSPEPIVGDVWIVARGERAKLRYRLADPYIYHHKWLMVKDDYWGFNVEESKERSRYWMGLGRLDKARIGRLGYWQRVVLSALHAPGYAVIASTHAHTRDHCSVV